MLKLNYVGDYNMNVNSGIEGHHSRNYIMVGFFIKHPLKSPPNDKMLPRGAIYFTQISSKILKPLFCDSWGSFAI